MKGLTLPDAAGRDGRPRNMEPGENPGQLALLYPVTKSHLANPKPFWFPFEPGGARVKAGRRSEAGSQNT